MLKDARNTRGFNARFIRHAVGYLVQMSSIQASYSLVARLLSGQRQKNLIFSLRALQNVCNTRFKAYSNLKDTKRALWWAEMLIWHQRLSYHSELNLSGGNIWGGIIVTLFYEVYTTVHYCSRHYSTRNPEFWSLSIFYKIQGVVIWSGTINKCSSYGLCDSIKTLKQRNYHVGFMVVKI